MALGTVGGPVSPPPHWLERGKPTRQAGLIVDPPDGQLPPYTPSREMTAYPAYPRSSYPSSYPPPGFQGGPPSTTMATWALVLGILPIPIGNLVAIGLAINVLSDSRDGIVPNQAGTTNPGTKPWAPKAGPGCKNVTRGLEWSRNTM